MSKVHVTLLSDEFLLYLLFVFISIQ